MSQAVKKITSIRVVKPGSAPDVDSDFHTAYRDEVLEHCEDLYGRGSLANIITFQTLAARGAFKIMCTIYEIPFVQANKIASLIPGPIEGVECTIDDIFNPKSSRYSEGADFRNAVSDSDWKVIIDGARAMESRVRATGVHPCGIVISSQPLSETIPLTVRQNDGRVITQWTYHDLEALGLIKFDFLGLDTVDLIAQTVEYIQRSGKGDLNMMDIIHGSLDDKKTFEMLARGESDGIFQLSSDGMKDLMRRLRPTSIEDIIATTALFRPGPMSMNAHIRYADVKNGRQKVEYPVHKDFKGTVLEEILKKTHFQLIYQEQVMQISQRIAGMTLQEGDDLRSAMGKKKLQVMLAMKPKFIDGGVANGYSEESMKALWDTMEPFAKYAFNRAHSVAYALMSYQAAYLKANYTTEFMAALISQNVGKKSKILTFLQEASRLGLKVGAADINLSEVNVAPDFTKKSEFDIVYGLSGVSAVSKDMAEIIIKERNDNGKYTSVQDVLNRCVPLGVTNRKIYENLALAGAFDAFNSPRKGVVENLPSMLNEAKIVRAKGGGLFDMLGEDEPTSISLDTFGEYSHLEKLAKESQVIGLFLTSHPLSNAGSLGGLRTSSILNAIKTTSYSKCKLIGSLTEMNVKRMKRGGKSVSVVLDDGTGFVFAFLSQEIIKGIDKRVAQNHIRSLYESHAQEVSPELEDQALDEKYDAIDELEIGQVYSFDVVIRPVEDGSYNARITGIQKIDLSHDGSLPVRVRLKKPSSKAEQMSQARMMKKIAKDHPGDTPVYVAFKQDSVEDQDSMYEDAIDAIRANRQTGRQRAVAVKSDRSGSTTLAGDTHYATKKSKKVEVSEKAPWPPPKQDRVKIVSQQKKLTPEQMMESLVYKQSKLMVEKSSRLARDLEEEVGIENYDFGMFDLRILSD